MKHILAFIWGALFFLALAQEYPINALAIIVTVAIFALIGYFEK